ncbi:MAG TPA: class I SAM-dependent methyltransferase [Gemmatales bacterium]|nr:class I SAM-dependent methyltransferase [Gemmatales bacterium]
MLIATRPRRVGGVALLLSLALGLGIGAAAGQPPHDAKPTSTRPEKPRYEHRRQHDPDGIGKFYMGREIAQVMGHLGAGWLERPEREEEEEPTKLLRALKLKEGDHVADIGAGTGYFTMPMARLVGATGRVYAVEIQQEMLNIVKRRANSLGLKNVVPIMGKINDPRLPADKIDLILMVDVYHEFSHPFEMTEAMLRSLKVGGRLVFVEYRGEDAWVPIKPLHKMTERQVLKEMEIWPVRHVETNPVLPRQHIIIFEKQAAS